MSNVSFNLLFMYLKIGLLNIIHNNLVEYFLGDPSKPKSWSKYAIDSSVHEKLSDSTSITTEVKSPVKKEKLKKEKKNSKIKEIIKKVFNYFIPSTEESFVNINIYYFFSIKMIHYSMNFSKNIPLMQIKNCGATKLKLCLMRSKKVATVAVNLIKTIPRKSTKKKLRKNLILRFDTFSIPYFNLISNYKFLFSNFFYRLSNLSRKQKKIRNSQLSFSPLKFVV